jgi:DME family drug/metabolite transporter
MTLPALSERPPAARLGGLIADRDARRGTLWVLAAALCWSTSGTFIRLIVDRYGLAPWTLAFWRDVLAFAGFLAISGLTRTGLRVPWRDLLPLAGMGAISVGLFHVSWVMAVSMIPVAVATVLNYTAPAFVVLFAWALWGEKPDRRQTTALILACAGCVLVTGALGVTRNQLNWPGLLIGLSTGATYASFTLIGKNVLKQHDPRTVLTYAFGFATLTLFVLNPAAGLVMLNRPAGAWAWVAALVLISTITGFGFYALGLKRLSAASASIAATVEPALAAGAAFLLLGQTIDASQMLGGLLVMSAVILLVR